MIDWEDFRVFLAVARQGSYPAAARPLGMAPATIRRHVETLEVRLGRLLFQRAAGAMTPTAAGLDLLPLAESMEHLADAAGRLVSDDPGLARGTVKISCAKMLLFHLLPPIVANLRRRFPEIRFLFDDAPGVSCLLQADADIAILFGSPADERLAVCSAGVARIDAYAHRDYLLERGAPTRIEEAPLHDLIGAEDPRELDFVARRLDLKVSDLNFVARCDSAAGQLALIKAGLGVGLCLAAVADADPDLVRLPLDALGRSVPVVVASLRSHVDILRITLVRDAVAEALTAVFDPDGLGAAR